MSDTDSSMTIGEEDDYVGWKSLSQILESPDKDDTCDFDDEEWPHENLYKQEYMIPNI